MKLFSTLAYILPILVSRLIALEVIHVYDDAFITYRYAENLANGMGFIYNQGEAFLGVTGPLFGLLVSAFSYLGLSLPSFIPLLNIAVDITIFLIIKRYIFNDDKFTSISFALIFAVSPLINRVAVGGMEMNIFLLLELISIILYNSNKKVLSISIASVAYFFRPEALILLLILGIYELISSRKNFFKLLIIPISVLAIGMMLIYLNYGNILPQSLVSKSTIKPDIFYVLKSIAVPYPTSLIIFLIGIPSSIIFRKSLLNGMPAIWLWVYIIAYLAGRPNIWSWYLLPIYVLLGIYSAKGIGLLARRFFEKFDLRSAYYFAILTIPLIVWITVFIEKGPDRIGSEIYQGIKNWSAEYPTVTKSIYANDIGAIGYFTGAQIYDSEGLISSEVQDYNNKLDLIDHKLPDYLFLNATRLNIKKVYYSDLNDKYKAINRFNPDGDKEISRDSSDYENHWKPDYILFERID